MKYIYHNKEENRDIEATPERWAWGVIYKDGKELKQFGDDGIFHRFGEIDQKEVAIFTIYKLEDPAKRMDLMPDGAQIFHFYRNTVLEHGTTNERHIRTYVFGWKDKGSAVYNYILPDDRIISAPGDLLKIE